MYLLPPPYTKLALLVSADELMASGLTRRRAKLVAYLRLLERAFKYRKQTR